MIIYRIAIRRFEVKSDIFIGIGKYHYYMSLCKRKEYSDSNSIKFGSAPAYTLHGLAYNVDRDVVLPFGEDTDGLRVSIYNGSYELKTGSEIVSSFNVGATEIDPTDTSFEYLHGASPDERQIKLNVNNTIKLALAKFEALTNTSKLQYHTALF